MGKSEVIKKFQFPSGVSGNPNGRPKGSKNKTTLLREALAAKDLERDDPILYYINKYLEIIEDKSQGTNAKMIALENLFNRIQGKPVNKVEHGKSPEDLAEAGMMVLSTLVEANRQANQIEAEDAEIIEK